MLHDLVAYIIIPIYTILFARDTNWFTTNFSVIGSWADRKLAFVLWGILVGTAFVYSLRSILRILPGRRYETELLITASVLLGLAVSTPYLPESLPFQAFLHVIFAFSASVLLLLCLSLVIWKLYLTDRSKYRFFLTAIIVIIILSGLLLLATGIVSSALEIFFTISCSVLIRKLQKTTQKAKYHY